MYWGVIIKIGWYKFDAPKIQFIEKTFSDLVLSNLGTANSRNIFYTSLSDSKGRLDCEFRIAKYVENLHI